MPPDRPQLDKLLIVDDSRSMLDLMLANLNQAYDVRAVISGAEALDALARGFVPDLILLDVLMPGMDGYAVCDVLKKYSATSEIPVIFMSGQNGEEDESRGLALGAVDYISKPFSFSIIKQRIASHLKFYKQQQRLKELLDIEKKLKEQALRSATEYQLSLESILLTAPVGICLLVEQRFKWLNQRMSDLVGYDYSQLIGQEFAALFADQTEAVKVEDKLKTQIHSRGSCALETRLSTSRGNRIDVILNAALHDKQHPQAGLILTLLDVTQNKQAQRQLARSESLHRELFSNISSGVALYSRTEDGEDYYINNLNPAGCAASQVDLDAVRGRRLTRVFPGAKAIGLVQVMNRVYQTGRPEHLDDSYYQDRDRDLWVNNYICRLSDNQLAVIFNDVTEQKKRENALQQAKKQWENTFNSISDIVTIQDDGFRIILANEAAYNFFSMAPHELHGRTCYELFALRSAPCPDCPLLKGSACKGKVTHQSLGKIFEVSSSPFRYDESSGRLLVHIARDITHQERMREHAERQNRLAAIGELAAGVAHEVNNPNGLILYSSEMMQTLHAELVEELEKPAPDLARTLAGGYSCREIFTLLPQMSEDILNSSQRIKRIVSSLREFSGRDELDKPEAVCLNQVIKTSLPLVEKKLAQSTHHLQLNLAENLPEVKGVMTQLEQVVVNLLLNAAQALTDKNQSIIITTRHDREEKMVILTVEDQGCGMEPDILKQAFEAFVTTRRNQGGTGLGLSVSHRIVAEHGGDIVLDSVAGRGTVAAVYLPLNGDRQ